MSISTSKRHSALYVIVVTVLLGALLFGCSGAVVDVTDSLGDIGIPYAEQYPTPTAGDQSRVPWDIKLHDGKLYVGAGNYNDNTGPIGLCWYDTVNGEWTTGGYYISEEQIHSFCELDGVLTIPGTDGVSSGNIGNFYQLKRGEWEPHSAIPNARHVFDMYRFDDTLFAAVGADIGFSPVRVSVDEGEIFEQVPIYAEGTVVDTSVYDMVRAYFLFEHDNKLYTLLLLRAEGIEKTHWIARYDDAEQAFILVNDFNDITPLSTALGMKHTFFTESVMWNGQTYFANGKLVRFADDKLELTGGLDNRIVYDLLVYEERLYVLTSSGKGADIRTTVYCTDDGKKFSPILEFTAPLYAVSFEMDDNNFYFGMANVLQPESEDTGSIYTVGRSGWGE